MELVIKKHQYHKKIHLQYLTHLPWVQDISFPYTKEKKILKDKCI